MDIASLLAAADAEVPTYDEDQFESFDDKLNQSFQNSSTQNNNNYNTSSKPPQSAASILKSAAETVARQEAQEAKEAFKASAEEVKTFVKTESPRPSIATPVVNQPPLKAEDQATLDILIKASEQVDAAYGIKSDSSKVAFTPSPRDSPRREDKEEERKSDMNEAKEEEEEESEAEKDEDEEDEEEENNGDDDEFDEKYNNELIFACFEGNLMKVRSFLDKNANPYFKDNHGWTILHWAASKGHVDIMEELFDFRQKKQQKALGPYINMRDQLAGWTPLHVRNCFPSYFCSYHLICCGMGWWPLQIAVVSGQKKTVKFLLDYGAKPRKRDTMRETPLEVLGDVKNAESIRKLLENHLARYKPKKRIK